MPQKQRCRRIELPGTASAAETFACRRVRDFCLVAILLTAPAGHAAEASGSTPRKFCRNTATRQETAKDGEASESPAREARERELRRQYGEPLVEQITVEGVVVDANGQPLIGQTVWLCERASYRLTELRSAGELPMLDPNPIVDGSIARTTTDNEGRFRFVDVTSKASRVYKERPSRWDVIVRTDGQAVGWASLPKAKPDAPLMVRIGNEFPISGIVVDQDGAPVANVEIRLAGLDDVDAPGTPAETDSTQQLDLNGSALAPSAVSDAAGRFEMRGLPAGKRASLATAHPSFIRRPVFVATTETPAPPVKQRDIVDGKVAEVEFPVLNPPARIALDCGYRLELAFAEEKSGQPLPGIKVNAWHIYGRGQTEAVTGDDGMVALGPFHAGTVSATVTLPKDTPLIARPFQYDLVGEERNRRVDVRLGEGRVVHGRIAGEPADKLRTLVAVFCCDQPARRHWPEDYSAPVAADGSFAIRVPPGVSGVVSAGRPDDDLTFDLPPRGIVRNTAGDSREALVAHGPKIPVAASGDATADKPVEIPVPRSAPVTGTVVDANGQPVARPVFELLNPDRFSYWFGFEYPASRPSLKVNPDGRFEITGLQRPFPAIYKVTDSGGQLALIHTFYCTPAGEERQIELKAVADVVGKVLLNGQPLVGQPVKAKMTVHIDAEKTGRGVGYPLDLAEVNTGDDGTYRFTGLPVGASLELFSSRSERDQITQRVHVTESMEPIVAADIAFVALSGNSTGMVVDLDGHPVSGAEISVHDAFDPMNYNPSRRGYSGRNGAYEPVRSGEDGSFTVENLPEGTSLDLRVRSPRDPDRPFAGTTAVLNFRAGDHGLRVILDPNLTSRPRKRD